MYQPKGPNAAGLLILALVLPLLSQTARPAFEVASVKAADLDSRTWALREVNPARYHSLSNVMQLITWAWKFKNYQILQAPAWASQDRFEINAVTGQPAGIDQERLMVQALLMDRFGLKVHPEKKRIPVYMLSVGRNGLKMETAKDGGDPKRRGINITQGLLEARQGGMDDFADALTTNLDRPVVNKTNLTGRYDFTLTWDPPGAAANGSTWAPIGSALFSLVPQLGLRLDPGKTPIEMLVIDSLLHPTPDR